MAALRNDALIYARSGTLAPTPPTDPDPDPDGGGLPELRDDEPDAVDLPDATFAGRGARAGDATNFHGGFERTPDQRLIAAADLRTGDVIWVKELQDWMPVTSVTPYKDTHTNVAYYAANAHPITRNRTIKTHNGRKFETRRAA